MANPITFAKKVIRVRKHLIKSGASKINESLANKIIGHMENWIRFNKPSGSQMKKYLLRHRENVELLIPKNKAGESMHNQLNQIIQL